MSGDKYNRIKNNLARFSSEKDFYMFVFWYKAMLGTVNRDLKEAFLSCGFEYKAMPEPTSEEYTRYFEEYTCTSLE